MMFYFGSVWCGKWCLASWGQHTTSRSSPRAETGATSNLYFSLRLHSFGIKRQMAAYLHLSLSPSICDYGLWMPFKYERVITWHYKRASMRETEFLLCSTESWNCEIVWRQYNSLLTECGYNVVDIKSVKSSTHHFPEICHMLCVCPTHASLSFSLSLAHTHTQI